MGGKGVGFFLLATGADQRALGNHGDIGSQVGKK